MKHSHIPQLLPSVAVPKTVLCWDRTRKYDWWHLFSTERTSCFQHPCALTQHLYLILCTSLIWNHLSFAAWFLCIFLKVVVHLIYWLNLASHSPQHFVLLRFRVIASCTIPCTINNLKGLGQLCQTIFLHY